MHWELSHSCDDRARPLADRHYSRQKPGTSRFAPPGRCLTLLGRERKALWVTSWPFAEYVKHEWAGAIERLEVHPRYPIEVNGALVCIYIGDFRYVDEHGWFVVEDVKSAATRTAVYRLKKRLLRAAYGIEIREVEA